MYEEIIAHCLLDGRLYRVGICVLFHDVGCCLMFVAELFEELLLYSGTRRLLFHDKAGAAADGGRKFKGLAWLFMGA